MANKLELKDLIQPEEIKNDSNSNVTDLIKLQVADSLLSIKNLKSNTRIKYQQVSHISKLYLFSDIFEVDFIKNLADTILQLQISINGLGRKELVDLVGKVYNTDIPELQKLTSKSIFK
jgi:hypothetical protein